jgi:diacylglycerol kinase (ATP)
MPLKIQLILNPAANHGRSVEIAESLHTYLADHHVESTRTRGPHHASDLARQAGEKGFDLVLAAGGDGTVHEVVNGLMQVPAKKRPQLGIVPLGSGNDFAHILGLPEDPLEALNSAVDGSPHSLDVGLMRSGSGRQEYFDNTLGMGFDAVVTIRTLKIKRVHGFLMYLLAVIQTIVLNFDSMDLHVETDREKWDLSTLMLTLGNGPREGGGFLVTPDAKLDDGILNYVTIRKISRLMMFRLIPEVMKGTHGRFKPIKMGTCKKLSVVSKQPIYVHLDGEVFSGFGSDEHELSIEIQPDALKYRKA